MTQQQLSQLYITHEAEIKASLLNQHIFDEDLFQDTCLEICVYAHHNEILNFPGLFIERYKKLLKRQGQHRLDIVPCDNAQLAALDIPDESQNVENIEQDIDWFNEQRREENKERLHKKLNYYYRHPQPGERDHQSACRILRLYLKGQSFRQIACKMKLDVATVYKYFSRTVERLKANTL